MTRAWLADRNVLRSGDRGLVMRLAAEHGDAKLFAELEAAAPRAQRTEQLAMLDAMLAFRDPALAERAIRLAMSDAVSPRALSTWAYRVKRENRELLWRLLEENVDALLERLPDDHDERLLSIGWSLHDDAERARFVRLFEPRLGRIRNGAGTFKEILAAFERAQVVKQRQRPSAQAWLKSR